MSYFVSKIDIPPRLLSNNKRSAFKRVVSRWCRTQNIKYQLKWKNHGPYIWVAGSERLYACQFVCGVIFECPEDFLAVKLRWF